MKTVSFNGRIEDTGSLDVQPFRRGSVLRIEGIGSLDVKPFRRVSVLRIEDTGSVDAKLLEMNVQPQPLRDITDDEWLKIMRIRSTPYEASQMLRAPGSGSSCRA